MRGIRSVTALVTLLFMALMAPALAAPGVEEVTLPSGEVVTIRAEGGDLIFTLANGMEMTRRSDGSGGSSLMAPMSANGDDIAKADEAYRIWQGIHPPERTRTVPVWAAVLLLGVGVFNLANPRLAWYLADGWKFKDAEPSDLALGVTRLMGALAVVLGIALLFVG